jgi:DNA polymerase III alpha subunit
MPFLLDKSKMEWYYLLMKRLVDLHTHTKYSQDSKNEPEDSCKRAIELGLKGVALPTIAICCGQTEKIK